MLLYERKYVAIRIRQERDDHHISNCLSENVINDHYHRKRDEYSLVSNERDSLS